MGINLMILFQFRILIGPREKYWNRICKWFEDNMHVAGDSSYKLIAQTSWQVDRISLNLETVRYFRNMCLSCEGLDREKYLVDMQETKEMIAKN